MKLSVSIMFKLSDETVPAFPISLAKFVTSIVTVSELIVALLLKSAAAVDIDIASSGLDASSVGILNISAGNFNNAGAINANNLNITAAADFSNSATINSDTVTIEVTNFANDIGNAGTVSSDSLNIILTDSFTHSSTSFTNFNNFSNLAISTEGTFTNNNAIDLAGNITITANTFINSNSVTAADNLSVVVSDHFTNSASTLKADNVDIQATGYILNSANGMIEATDNLNIVTATLFNVAAGATVSNGDVGGNIIAANLTIETGALNNINTDGDINGNITVNSFNLSVAGAFDYEGTITTNNAFNLNVGGDFSYNDTNNDFVWGANDTLTVLGNANIVAADFANSGTITVTNSSLNLTATNFTNTGTISANTTLNTTVTSTVSGSFNNTGGVVSADTFSLSVAGAFDYITEYLGNGTINNNALNLNVGGNFSNNNSANNFNWGDNDILTVLGTASVVAADFTNSGTISVTNSSLNLTATNFTNAGTISANTTLNTTVSSTVSGSFDNTGGVLNADTVSLSVAGDFDYVAEYLGNGTITTNTLNLNVGGDFSNNDANNDFVWNASDSLVVLGNASVTADSFNNSGTITVSNSSFDITATDFTNSGTISANTTLNTTVTSTVSGSFNNTGGVVSADTFALSVAGDFDYVADFNGTITTNTLNLNVGGDFSNNDANNDFTWGANDTLTVLGNASIDAASFNNSGTINVINSFDITAAADFDNSGTINVTNIFDITAAADFDNSGTISANSFNTTVNTFNNKAGAEITAAECNLVVNTTPYTDNGTITCLDSADDTMVIDIARPDANGLSNNSYETFHIPSNGIVLNNSDSDGTSQLAGDISANTNYSSGDAASIILNQVTGTIISLLVGTLEVFGAEAVVIIANPNGITCNGCAFLNASRVDLVTASSYNFDADSFDSIENTNIAIIDNGLDASSSGILNIQAGGFTNTGVLKANSFNLSVIGDFDNTKKGIINATSFNLNVGGDFSNNDASSDFIWDTMNSLTVSGSANIVAAGFNNSGIITVTNSSLNLTATDFTNNGTISANTTLNTTVSNTPSGSFNNTGGVLNADTVSLSLAGDFDDTKKGIINANYFNLTVGGSFINNNTNSDFVLAENDSLSILGDFTIATNNYIQFGTLEVSGDLAIETESNFFNSGAITTESLEITAGYTAINQGSIVSGSLAITADDFFRNLTGGDISTDTLNIIAGGKVTNTANITVGTLNIIANDDSSRTNDTTGFYVSNRGNITATTLNIAAVDNFYNRGNITATTFNITRAKSVFFLNREIDSFYAAGHTYDGGNISLAGDSSFIAAGGSIENYGNIDLGVFNLDLTANSFTNHEDANVTANTVNLTVNSYINGGIIDATINQ